MKRTLSLLLTVLMLVTLLPVAGLAQDDVVKLTWFVDVPSFIFNSEGWGVDPMTQELTEKFGIEIEFITAADDSGAQLATLISSDSVPDLITLKGLWNAPSVLLIKQMAEAGYLYAYDDLIDEYVPEDEKAGFRHDVLAWYAQADGKTYAYPNYAYSVDDMPQDKGLSPNRCIVVRADMYEQLGSPDMSSPEKFLEACERAMTEIGTYNELPVIGMQLYENGNEAIEIIQQYFAVPWETEEGHVLNAWASGDIKETVQFLNEAYRMGLIQESNYSDTREQIKEKIANGRVFALIAAPQDFADEFRVLYDADPNAYYMAVELRNSAGDDPVLTDISGWGYLQTVVSANCKAPDRLAKLLAYLVNDEGAIHMNKGWEGEQWNWNEDGTISATDEYRAQVAADSQTNKRLGIGCFDLFANAAFLMQFDTPLDLSDPLDLRTSRTADRAIKAPMDLYSHRAAQYKYDPEDERAMPVAEEETKYKNYNIVAFAELITAPTEEAFEAKFEDVSATIPTIYDRELVTQYRDDALQAAKQQLGVEFFWPPYAEQ